MADLSPVIETMEHRFMRAWIERDLKALKSVTSRDFILLMGSKPATLLDNRSWLEAATTRYFLSSYRFGDIYVRDLGGMALFASQLEIDATLDGKDWSGRFWVTDLWRKGKVRRRWRVVERVLSRPDEDKRSPAAMRALQLWR